jgi:hypothetical protein
MTSDRTQTRASRDTRRRRKWGNIIWVQATRAPIAGTASAAQPRRRTMTSVHRETKQFSSFSHPCGLTIVCIGWGPKALERIGPGGGKRSNVAVPTQPGQPLVNTTITAKRPWARAPSISLYCVAGCIAVFRKRPLPTIHSKGNQFHASATSPLALVSNTLTRLLTHIHSSPTSIPTEGPQRLEG